MRHPHEVKLAMEQVARRRGMTVNAMLGKSHEPQFVDARRELARILRARHLSWDQIARYMGKDHSTIVRLVLGRPVHRLPLVIECPDLSGEWAV